MKQELLALLAEMRRAAVAVTDGNSEATLVRMEQMLAGLPEFHRADQHELDFDKPSLTGNAGKPMVNIIEKRVPTPNVVNADNSKNTLIPAPVVANAPAVVVVDTGAVRANETLYKPQG